MKKYIQPCTKCRKGMMQPYALDIHSGQGDSEQLSGGANFDENEPMPAGKDVWSE
jgi:hypothetical protein